MTIIAAICGRRSIAAHFPEWELGHSGVRRGVCRHALPYDVLDPTKIIPEEILPVRLIGRMVLDRNPDNFFAETEQVAYCPANIVPGIDFTNDPLLQGRLFSYLDTQKSRLGTANFHQLADQCAEMPVDEFPARRPNADECAQGPRQLRTEQPGRRRRGGRAARMSGDRVYHFCHIRPRRTNRATSCAFVPNCSPIITARRGCSGAR